MLALPEIVKLLLSHSKCDPCQQDQHGQTALIFCCHGNDLSLSYHQKNVRIVKMLLKHENCGIAIYNDEGQSALMYACQNALPEIVELLLRHKECDPCQQDLSGNTPIIFCCCKERQNQTHQDSYVRIVQMLLKRDNCGLALCNKDCKNALMYACKLALPEIVELLLSHRECDPCQQDQHGNTALVICCYGNSSLSVRENHVRIVKTLLKHKNCGIAIRNNKEQNALMYACQNALPEIVELLLSHTECDPCQQDLTGNTPFMFCCFAAKYQSNLEKYVRIVHMLLKKDICGIANMQ